MEFIEALPSDTKANIVKKIQTKLLAVNLTVVELADTKPWGAYFRINEAQATQFRATFFQGKDYAQDLAQTPKILLVAPNQRLSWQYHHRRKEIWNVLQGPIKVARGTTDEDQKEYTYQTGEIIELNLAERHRLIGTQNWGIVAEIWYHTDNAHPSDEDDIVRVSDDYGR